MIAPFIEYLAVDAPANETFSAFLQDYWAIVSDKDVAILTAEITAEAMRMPDIARLFLEVRRNLAHALSALLEKGITQGIWWRCCQTHWLKHLRPWEREFYETTK